MNLLASRLFSQKLTGNKCTSVEEAVGYFGAVQAQDFSGAKWSLGLRVTNATNETIEKAYNSGKILRTHVLRPTWHFVTPEDIRAFLVLSSPQIKQLTSYYNRKRGLTQDILKKTNTLIANALKGNNFLTRQEIKALLQKRGITPDVQSLGLIVMQSEIDGIITSGPMQGKQFTYALLEERVAQTKPVAKDKALATLAEKYFTSHGPAQIKDFAWWSGLSRKDATEGIYMIMSKLEKITINNKTYWFSAKYVPLEKIPQDVFLLSVYDEYFISYTDRSELYDQKYKQELPIGNALLTSLIIINGTVAGTWKRTIDKQKVVCRLFPFETFTSMQKAAVQEIVTMYGKFFGLQAKWE